MATLFTCSFPSIKNVTWTINVDDRDHVGAATTVDCAADGFTLTYDGAEDILTPVIGSRLEFTMAVDSTTESAIQSFATALISSDEERYTIEIQRDSGSGDSLYWVGYVLPDLSGFEDLETPYGFKVSAVDGLSRLKSVEYNDGASPPEPYGVETFITHILNCLTQGTLHTAYYGATDHFLKTCVNWLDSRIGTPTAAKCPLAYSRVNGEIFAERNNSNDTTEWNFKSCYEVLEIIMRNWQCRLLYSEGAYRVEQVAERAQDNFYERRFSYDGTLQSSTASAAADVTIQQTTVNEKLAGNIFNYLPAISKATATWEHKTVKNWLAGTGGKWIGGSVQTTTVVIPNVTTDANTRFFITAGVSFNIDLGAVYNDIPWRYVVLMRVYKNSQYIKSDTFSLQNGQGDYLQQVGRDPDITWSGTTAAYEISSDFSVTDSINHLEVVNIEIDNIPTSGDDITVVFTLDGAYELDETPILSAIVNNWAVKAPQFYIVDSTDEDTFIEQIRVYEAENPETGNSNELTFDMAFGGAVQGWTLSKLQTYNGSTWADSGATWDRDTNTDNLAFGQLWVQQAMALMKYPTKTYTGQFLTKSLMPHSRAVFDFDSSAWLMLRGTFSAREHIFQGVWMAAGIDETSITPGPPIKKGAPIGAVKDPELSFIPGRFDPTATGMRNRLAEIGLVALTANFVGSTISAGSITSIPVRESIPADAFIDGDNIFILNPSSGEVESFTVSTTSTAGDTAIAVDSKSISNDIPAGGIILYSVMNKYTQTGGTPLSGLPAGTDTQTVYYNSTTPTASSALRNDGTYISINEAPSTSYMLRIKGASGPKGLFVERDSSSAGVHIYHDGSATIESVGGLNLDLESASGSIINLRPGGGGGQIRQVSLTPGASVTSTLGNNCLIDILGTYAPTASGGDFSAFRIGCAINQTGSADQITRGLMINPTFTAVASAGFRAIDYPGTQGHFLYQGGSLSVDSYHRGNIVFGGSSDNPGAKVDITGDSATSASDSLRVRDSAGSVMLHVRDDSRVGVLTSSPGVTLDVATATDGIALPEGTTAQRPSVNNSIRLNSDADGLEVRYGAKWHRLTCQVAPTIAAGAAAGTGPSVAIDTGNDLCHQVSVTTGTSPATGTLATITFNQALDSGMFVHVVFSAKNANAAGEIAKFYIGSTGNTSYTIACASAPTASTQYVFHVMVKQ